MTTSIETWRPAAPAYAERPPYNTLAAISLALTLLTVIGGIVCGHVALSQIRRTGERGRWLAVTALVLGYTYLGVIAAFFTGLFGLALTAWLQR